MLSVETHAISTSVVQKLTKHAMKKDKILAIEESDNGCVPLLFLRPVRRKNRIVEVKSINIGMNRLRFKA